MSEYDITAAFKVIEDELISSMIRNMDRHRAQEDKEGMQWSQWQAEQFKALEKYKQKNQKKYKKQFSSINNRMEGLIRAARETGNMQQEIEILKAIKNGFKGYHKASDTLSAEFFKLSDRKLDALIKATTADMEKAETAVLRMANDQYRKAIFNAQIYANTGAGTYAKAVDMATRDMLAAGLNCVQYANGARHTLSDYADMAIKTASKRAYLQGAGEKRQEWGISTVIINKRGNPCPKCLPWVGKILIDDVWSGGGSADDKYPLMSYAISKGLYHPRCRDSHTTYFDGISTTDDAWTQAELEAVGLTSKQEAKQQYARRQAERFERLTKYSLDSNNRKIYQEKAGDWNKAIDKNSGTAIINMELLDTNSVIARAQEFGEEVITNRDFINANDDNPIFEYITRKLGYNRVPIAVSAEAFKLASEQSKVGVLYRGISASTKDEAEKLVTEFKKGSFFTGRKQAYGHGIYFSPVESIAREYAESGSVIKATLSKDAKVVDYMEIMNEYALTGANTARWKKGRNTELWEDMLPTVGEYAAIKGYDAIAMNGFNSNQHIIVLNRGKVLVEE